MVTPIAQHLLDAQRSAVPVADRLAPDVRFSSPYADYSGRDQIAALLRLMPDVFDELAVRRELTAAAETVTILHGRMGEHRFDAFLDEQYDARGEVRELMLSIRPLEATKEAIRRMGARRGAES